MSSTLKERLQEVMEAMQWEYSDLVAAAGESHSVVSQWLGRGSKIIKTIGKLEAAERIEAASGYSALWVAKGMGPKKRTRIDAEPGIASASGHKIAITVTEPAAGYASPAQMGVRLAAEFAMLPETFADGTTRQQLFDRLLAQIQEKQQGGRPSRRPRLLPQEDLQTPLDKAHER